MHSLEECENFPSRRVLKPYGKAGKEKLKDDNIG